MDGEMILPGRDEERRPKRGYDLQIYTLSYSRASSSLVLKVRARV